MSAARVEAIKELGTVRRATVAALNEVHNRTPYSVIWELSQELKRIDAAMIQICAMDAAPVAPAPDSMPAVTTCGGQQ